MTQAKRTLTMIERRKRLLKLSFKCDVPGRYFTSTANTSQAYKAYRELASKYVTNLCLQCTKMFS